MKKKKVIAFIATIIIVGALGGAGFYYRNEIINSIPFLGTSQSDDKVYVEKVSKIMNQSNGASNRYNGIVESQDTYEVNVDSSRTIKEILVQVGDTVEEGQALVTYDSSDIEMQIKQAQLELESINNEIDNAKKQIENLNLQISKTDDSDEVFSYTTEIQSTENTIAQSEFDLESKNLEIEKYRKQIADSTVVSKKAGVVKEINENGTDSNGNSAAFMTILQAGEYRVKGSVDEQNVWTVSEGQQVLIRSRVDETKTWNGAVNRIDTENIQKNSSDSYGTDSDGAESSTKYPFYIELESVDGLLLGQHVYVEFNEGQEETKEGVWLFSNYVVQDDTGSYVWTSNDKKQIEKRYVELGEYDTNLDEYEIVSGLSSDDYITWPMQGIYEGVTTVTDVNEVDYSSPLYNQESTEIMEGGEGIYMGTEMPEIPEGAVPLYDEEDTQMYESGDAPLEMEEVTDTEVEE